jgi:uncharacterized phage infection (PIP) family protein YhgE
VDLIFKKERTMDVREQIESYQQELMTIQRKYDVAKGQLENALAKLKREHGVATEKEARKLLADKQKKLDSMEDELQEAIKKFEAKYL